MALEDTIFSAGGGFLFGVVVGFALKKLMKLAAMVLGLFLVGLAYLSYKGWVDVKWIATEYATKSTLIDKGHKTGSPFCLPTCWRELVSLSISKGNGCS